MLVLPPIDASARGGIAGGGRGAMLVAVLGPGGVGGRAGTGCVDGVVTAGDHVRVGAGQRRVRGRVGARASRRSARPGRVGGCTASMCCALQRASVAR